MARKKRAEEKPDSAPDSAVNQFAPVTAPMSGVGPSAPAGDTGPARLYLVEDQPILMESYQNLFRGHAHYEIAGTAESLNDEALLVDIPVLKPDVLLCGVKSLNPATVAALREINEISPATPFMVMAGSYSPEGMRDLQEFVTEIKHGWACVLKENIDSMDAFAPILNSVIDGRITLDPALFQGLMDSGDVASIFLKELSPQEAEIAGWIAKGYDDGAIGDLLNLPPSSIERQVASIYGKLPGGPEHIHPRVRTAILYLGATGYLRD